MLYCRECAVELEAGHKRCPLCGGGLDSDASTLVPETRAYPKRSEAFPGFTDRLLRHRPALILASSLILAPPALICTLFDYLYTGGTWFFYVVYSLSLVWALIFIGLAFIRLPTMVFMAQLTSLEAFFVALNLAEGQVTWAFSLALPILLFLAGAVLVAWFGFHFFSDSPGYALSFSLIAVVFLCLGTNFSVNAYLGTDLRPTWALLVAVTLGSLALALTLAQFVYKRSASFQRFFHW